MRITTILAPCLLFIASCGQPAADKTPAAAAIPPAPPIDGNADLVVCGYGVTAPEYQWNDFKVDVKGKIIIVLINDPQLEDQSKFGGKAMTYYGRWTYKFEEAARQGAAGALIVHETPLAGYPWEVVRGSWSGEQS